jgi:hypothetical protein
MSLWPTETPQSDRENILEKDVISNTPDQSNKWLERRRAPGQLQVGVYFLSPISASRSSKNSPAVISVYFLG